MSKKNINKYSRSVWLENGEELDILYLLTGFLPTTKIFFCRPQKYFSKNNLQHNMMLKIV